MNLEDTIKGLEAVAARKRFNTAAYFKLYKKQIEHVAAGVQFSERMLLGGNQTGKTSTGGLEAAFHLTGDYPDWWPGRRFDHPTLGWVCGETAQTTRDKPQSILCGPAGVSSQFGTGFIPKDRFVYRGDGKPDISLSRGVTDAYDTVQVKHRTNGVEDGVSVLRFKSYDQGREKFASETLDFIWNDEEPPMDIYGEEVPRTIKKKGMIFTTLTPLDGMTALVKRFYEDKLPSCCLTMLSIEDVDHYTKEERAAIIAQYPVHQRKARSYGIPMLGSGVIFLTPESMIVEEAIEQIPREWVKLWGIDFGINHPFAAVLAAWDKEADIIHITHALRIADSLTGKPEDALPSQHALPMKRIGAAVPVAWPHDGHARDKGSGKALSQTYRECGLNMLPEHATFEDGGYSTEAAVQEVQQRCVGGRFKVAAHLSEWLAEYRSYHRKDGLIVKLNDDLLSATFKIIMAKRFARAVPLGKQIRRSGASELALGTNDNPLDWYNDPA